MRPASTTGAPQTHRRAFSGALPVLSVLSLAACTPEFPVLFPFDAGMVPSVVDGRFLSLGHRHTCELRAGRIRCWGDGTSGQLGNGAQQKAPAPITLDAGTDWTSLSTGEQHSCGLKQDGSIWCFGGNQAGQLGVGDLSTRLVPTRVTLPGPARSLSAHYSHTCAVLFDDSGWCWGSNWEGQLGLNDSYPGADQPAPQRVFGGLRWKVLEAGDGHTCGVDADGALWCWGRNVRSMLGLGAGAGGQVRPPTRIGASTDWAALSASQEGTCGLTTAEGLRCWGVKFEDPNLMSTRDVPLDVYPGRWRTFRIDTFHACGLQVDGSLWCIGRGIEGQLGLGDFLERRTLTRVGTDTDWVELQVGRFHTCARKANGTLWCTGQGDSGQLGAGDFNRRSTFTLVP